MSMKLSDGLTRRERKRKKQSGEHVHGRRINRIEYTEKPGKLSDYMDNVKGRPTQSAQVGKVHKKVAQVRGTF